MTRGKLDPGFKPDTVDDRLAGVDAEIKRVETLQQEFGKRQGTEAAQVVKWAETYLKTLREGRRSIVGDTLVADAKHVPVQGVYVSRSKGVRSGALSLLCLLTRTAAGYKVVLHDMTQLYEASSYRFEAEAAKPEQAFKAVFTDHATAYPDGSLPETFTAWDEKTQALGTTYVQFEKRTDTLGKDVKIGGLRHRGQRGREPGRAGADGVPADRAARDRDRDRLQQRADDLRAGGEGRPRARSRTRTSRWRWAAWRSTCCR